MESLMSPSSLGLLIALDHMDQLQDKYGEMITRRPRDVSALLRSSYREGKRPDNIALLMLISDAIHDRGDQLKELLLGGLHNVFVDILTDHTVYTLQLLARSVELWDIIWSKRILLQGGTITDLSYPKAIERLTSSWNAMIDCNFSSENPLCTRLGHVAIYCWHHPLDTTLSSHNTRGDALLTVLTSRFINGCSQQTRDQLVQEAIVDTFGPQAWVQRLRRALEDPGCLNNRLREIIDVINYFCSHPPVRQTLWACEIQKCIFVALKRQQLFGDAADEWPIVATAATSICRMLRDVPISVYRLIMYHDIFKWTARAMLLGAESPIPATLDGRHLVDHWLYIVDTYTHVFRVHIAAPAATEGPVHVSYPSRPVLLMVDAARKVWYRTLLDIRALHLSADKPMPSRQRALEAWTSFGNAIGLVESEEEERWVKVRNTQPYSPQETEVASSSSSSGPLALQRYCSWMQCEYHTKEPRYPMMQCARCGNSRYCNRSCQANDWKHGVHRLVCYARKE